MADYDLSNIKIKYISNEKKTFELCLAAVRMYGQQLVYVPHDKKTPELCLIAVQQYGEAIKYVPDEKMTIELCIAAVQQTGWALKYIPDEMKTPELCLVAVQQTEWALEFVPEEIKTIELCLIAVQKGGMLLNHVPEHLRTVEVVQAALLQNPGANEFLTQSLKIHQAAPKQMPEKAYDTLEMGYDEFTAIQDGEEMVDFHREFEYGRYYRKATFEKFVLPSKKNPLTGVIILEYRIYTAVVVVDVDVVASEI